MPLVEIKCSGCKRVFKSSGGLTRHTPSCAWLKQIRMEEHRRSISNIRDEALPPESAVAHGMESIAQRREETNNPVFPYPTLADALTGVVSSFLEMLSVTNPCSRKRLSLVSYVRP
jgi:AraC-like DNA-binding protein